MPECIARLVLKGCAIVEFSSKEDARSAIKELNDTMFDGAFVYGMFIIWGLEGRERHTGQL